jgi:hypothetical protein
LEREDKRRTQRIAERVADNKLARGVVQADYVQGSLQTHFERGGLLAPLLMHLRDDLGRFTFAYDHYLKSDKRGDCVFNLMRHASLADHGIADLLSMAEAASVSTDTSWASEEGEKLKRLVLFLPAQLDLGHFAQKACALQGMYTEVRVLCGVSSAANPAVIVSVESGSFSLISLARRKWSASSKASYGMP